MRRSPPDASIRWKAWFMTPSPSGGIPPPKSPPAVLHAGSEIPLTSREREVLRLIALGRSDRDIGEELFISRATAARHVANIFLKLSVNTRTAAAAYAFRHGLSGS